VAARAFGRATVPSAAFRRYPVPASVLVSSTQQQQVRAFAGAGGSEGGKCPFGHGMGAKATMPDSAAVQDVKAIFDALKTAGAEGLKHGLDVTAIDADGRNLVHHCAIDNAADLLRSLAKNAAPEKLQLALKQGDVMALTPLHVAAAFGSSDVVGILVQELGMAIGELAGKPAVPAIFQAAQYDRPEVIKLLLTLGADVNGPPTDADAQLRVPENQKGMTPMHVAALFGSTNAVNALAEAGATVDPKALDGSTPLFNTAQRGAVATAEALLARGADVNAQLLDDGLTPLMQAVLRGEAPLAATFLNHGADPRLASHIGHTALHAAAVEGNAQCVELIASREGMDIDILQTVPTAGYSLLTPLHVAIIRKHLDAVRVLLKMGANPNASLAVREVPTTPLHIAVGMMNHEIAKELIAAGANIEAQDQYGWTPVIVAQKVGLLGLLFPEQAAAAAKLAGEAGGVEPNPTS
jgi:ankyrin repeat protein